MEEFEYTSTTAAAFPAASTSTAVKSEPKEPAKAPKAKKEAPAAKEKEAKVSDANPAVTLADDAEDDVAGFAASLEWEARRIYGGQAGGKAAKWSVKGSTITVEFE